MLVAAEAGPEYFWLRTDGDGGEDTVGRVVVLGVEGNAVASRVDRVLQVAALLLALLPAASSVYRAVLKVALVGALHAAWAGALEELPGATEPGVV